VPVSPHDPLTTAEAPPPRRVSSSEPGGDRRRPVTCPHCAGTANLTRNMRRGRCGFPRSSPDDLSAPQHSADRPRAPRPPGMSRCERDRRPGPQAVRARAGRG
jgi:hypothetical protein